MKRLLIILIAVVAVFTVLPIRDTLDNGALDYSVVKRSIESISVGTEDFVEEFNRLAVISQALTASIVDGASVYFEYATLNEWQTGYGDFLSEDGYYSFRLRIRREFNNRYHEEYMYFPTYFDNMFSYSYNDYQAYCKEVFRPIKAFIDIYNEWVESGINIGVSDFIFLLALIPSGLFAIMYLMVCVLFDSLAVVLSVFMCIFRCFGFLPLPRI